MAEGSGQEKTESPTERRREEIRNEGRVAYSREITSSAVLGTIVVALYFSGSYLFDAFINLYKKVFSNLYIGEFNYNSVANFISYTSSDLMSMVLFIMALIFVFGAVMGVVQLGFRITLTPIQPNFSKINPLQGLKRIFSLGNLVDGVKIIIKLIIIGAVVYFIVINQVSKIAAFSNLDFISFCHAAWDLMIKMLLQLFLAFLLISGFDFLWQRFNFERQIKMTKQEYKEDLRNTEGDPLIKARIRQIQQKMSRARMLQDVPDADVVIANPTHYAIVLKYDPEVMNAPKVVAKGIDFLALRIIEIAQAAGVSVTRRPELARGLYGQLEVGDNIPEEFYQIIAEILAAAYKAKGLKFQPKAG